MQSFDYITKSRLDKIKSEILNFLSETSCNDVYYTANFNNYSNTSPLIESICVKLGKPLIIFCDASSSTTRSFLDCKNHLSITVARDENVDPRLFAKIFKIMPHLFFSKTTRTIWLDSNISMKKDDIDLIVKLEKNNLVLFAHDKRNSVTEEYIECLKYKKDSSKKLKKFSQFLAYNKDPEFLCQGRIIYRNTNLKVQDFNEIWWDYVQKGSIRDQLSLPYAINQSNIVAEILSPVRLSDLFQIHFHNKISFAHNSNFMNMMLFLRNMILKIREVLR